MSFEEQFFGEGNLLKWDAIESGTMQPERRKNLEPFLETLKNEDGMILLPRAGKDRKVQWYAMCSSGREMRSVKDRLRAFLGETYSDVMGEYAALSEEDPVDSVVLNKFGRNAIRITVPDENLFEPARERIMLMLSLDKERPPARTNWIRPVGRILRDFEYSMIVGDGESGQSYINELRTTGRLDAINHKFLEIRRLGVLRKWNAILLMPGISSVLEINRPKTVTETLMKAVYHRYLKGFEENRQAAKALDYFKEKVTPQYGTLFNSRVGLSGFEIDASFLIHLAAHARDGGVGTGEKILEKYGEGKELEYLEEIASLITPEEISTDQINLERAVVAYNAWDIDGAYDILIGLPPSKKKCELLVRCAREMGSLSSMRNAIQAFQELSGEEKSSLLDIRQFTVGYENITGLIDRDHVPETEQISDPIPQNLLQWLGRLKDGFPWPQAYSIAEIGAKEWDYESTMSDPAHVAEIGSLILSDLPSVNHETLLNSLPHLVKFLLDGRNPDYRAKEIYDALFLRVAVDSTHSIPQLEMLFTLVEARIALGMQSEEYADTVDALAVAFEMLNTHGVLNMYLDAADILLGEVCPEVHARQAFIARICAFFEKWRKRVNVSQIELLSQFSEEAGIPELVPKIEIPEEVASESVLSWSVLNEKYIALYSLRKSVLERVSKILKKRCPTVRISMFSDSVGGGSAIREAAKNADIFVLATAAAKHSATGYIMDNRAEEGDVLYSRGQGSASMLDAIASYVESKQ